MAKKGKHDDPDYAQFAHDYFNDDTALAPDPNDYDYEDDASDSDSDASDDGLPPGDLPPGRDDFTPDSPSLKPLPGSDSSSDRPSSRPSFTAADFPPRSPPRPPVARPGGGFNVLLPEAPDSFFSVVSDVAGRMGNMTDTPTNLVGTSTTTRRPIPGTTENGIYFQGE